jgi:hypothetical protein
LKSDRAPMPTINNIPSSQLPSQKLSSRDNIRYVRFLLSPPPEEDMETRHRVVLPTAEKDEEVKFGTASSWGRDELRLLGVDFSLKKRVDLNRILRVRESEWSEELRARTVFLRRSGLIFVGVDDGTQQLASVEMEDINSGAISMHTVRKKLAPDFLSTFKSLRNVMSLQEAKLRARQESSNTSQPVVSSRTKRPPQSPAASTSIKRTKIAEDQQSPSSEPKTPDQPTHPADPDFSGTSTESKDEENTKMLLKLLLEDTLNTLEADFCEPRWQRSGYMVELCRTYSPIKISF